jgi:5-hydroxyisourate hydrolase
MNNGYLTTHVLDIGIGKPGFDIPIELFNDGGNLIHQVTTNSDGRTEAPLLSEADFKTGKYALIFSVKNYLKQNHQLVEEPFYDNIKIEFMIRDQYAHYHIPLLLSPYGYSTYRGS